jgi:hypothetical protein
MRFRLHPRMRTRPRPAEQRNDGELQYHFQVLKRMKSAIERQWKTLLVFLGVAAFSDLAKEFFRARAMDWMAAKLGPSGTWLVANPAGFLTLGLLCVVVALFFHAMVEALWPPPSMILDANERPFPRAGMSPKWTLGFGLITALVLVLVAIGSYKYYEFTHRPPAPAGPTHFAISTAPIKFDDMLQVKKSTIPTPCSLKNRKTYESLEDMPGGETYTKPYLLIEPKTLILQQTADRKNEVEVLMEVTVVNRGEASIAKDWKLCFLSESHVYWYDAEQVTDETKFDYHDKQPMPDISSQPVGHGKAVRGWFLFLVPNEVMQKWKYQGGLRCRDYLEHEYSSSFGPSPQDQKPGPPAEILR